MSSPQGSWVPALDTWARTRPNQIAFRYLRDGEDEDATVTWRELNARVRSIAASLRRDGLQGERVLLLEPPGLEFVASFLGCLMAGVTVVPLHPVNLVRPTAALDRLLGIAADCRPVAAIADDAQLAKLAAAAEEWPALRGIRWLSDSAVAMPAGAAPLDNDAPLPTPGTLAFLQYTSGSTAAPKGVCVSHANIASNAQRILASYQLDPFPILVSWLPPYHDMGLIGCVLQPVFVGGSTTLMSPFAFLQRPFRWLAAISRYRAAISFAPNFAFDLAVRRFRPEQCEGLDLSCWKIAGNGAEPVQIETLNRFASTFEPYGFRRDAFCPSYGLAECTLHVSNERGVRTLTVDAARLAQHEVAPCETRPAAETRTLVSMGHPIEGLTVTIADPDTHAASEPERIGEIWVSGPSVAQGYFRRAEETADTFGARRADVDEGPFLRTGDFGFVHDGALYVTGRLKDLIVIDGRNHYPQDIEQTVQQSHPWIPPAGAIAFSVDREQGEALIVVAERPRAVEATPDAFEDASRCIRRAVSERHDVRVRSLVWVPSGVLPKTASGKPRRRLCRATYLEGRLGGIEVTA